MKKMVGKMTVGKMIEKFKCELVEDNGEVGIRISVRSTKDQAAQLRAAKNKIIAELKKED